jgi:uncharacterized protein YbjT (DUF2867 family)
MKVILFGGTGMVGQSVLRECLRDDDVETVLSIGRKSVVAIHPKLLQMIRNDMFDVTVGDAELNGYDACFFCLGISSAGMNEVDYTHMTYDLTMVWAQKLATVNPKMTFIYVSGAGTGGKSMWAQVKGRTEKALLELFPNAYMFRLAAMRPMHGEKSKTRWTRISYKVFGPLLPLVRKIAPNAVITSEELGRAMIRLARQGAQKRVLENRDMIELGK